MFAISALSFSTTITALTTKNKIIRDLSLGAYFVFTMYFLWFYALYVLFLSGRKQIIPYSTAIYWSGSGISGILAVFFRSTGYPESFFVKRRFRKLMQQTFEEKFAIQSGGETVEHKTTESIPTKDSEKEKEIRKSQRESFKQQVSFAKMLEDIQSFTIQTENKLARIENLEKNLYDDMDDIELQRRKEKLSREIEALENEIVNEIKNEIQVEQCMEDAYVSLISSDQKQWFNYFFTSHNFWHIFMNLAVLFSVVGWKDNFIWRADEANFC